MTLLVRNVLVSFSLAISDLLGFVTSIYLAIWIMFFFTNDTSYLFSSTVMEGWIFLHWILAFFCIGWYSMRLRHYFYRKTFWFELKEILRTLVIFATIEIAVLAFTTWSFPRIAWILTWVLVLVLVPTLRMVAKLILHKLNLWQRDTWVIGCGANAQEAYLAINSERNLGLNIVGFVASDGLSTSGKKINGLPVIAESPKWLKGINKKTQFSVNI